MSRKLGIALAATAAVSLGALPAGALARHGQSGHRHGHASGRTQSTVAGTIASFKAGVLTITKADGTPISAAVTARTQIECEASSPTATTADRHGGGQSGGSDDTTADRPGTGQSGGSDDTATETQDAQSPENEATEPAGEDQSGAAGSSTTTGSAPAACDQTALVVGAVVTRARIRDDGTGPAFKQIKVVR